MTMTTGTTSWRSSIPGPSLLGSLVAHVRLSLRLLREPAVPLVTKALPVAATAYLLSPLDFVPDFLPILGQLDDAGVLLLALGSFVRLCPLLAVEHHRAAMAAGRPFAPMPPAGPAGGAAPGGAAIDAEFTRHDDAR